MTSPGLSSVPAIMEPTIAQDAPAAIALAKSPFPSASICISRVELRLTAIATKHVLFIAAENGALPGGKVGGVGDVIRDLPRALQD